MWMAGVIDDWACRAVRYPRHQTPHSSLSTVDCRWDRIWVLLRPDRYGVCVLARTDRTVTLALRR